MLKGKCDRCGRLGQMFSYFDGTKSVQLCGRCERVTREERCQQAADDLVAEAIFIEETEAMADDA